MRLFLGVITRGSLPIDRLLERVERMAANSLPDRSMAYRSDVWVAPSGRLALCAWDNEAAADEPLLEIAPDGRSARARGGYRYMVDSGDASGITLDDASLTLTATTALTRSALVYWTRTSDAWLVSSRALLLARLARPDGLPAYDPAGVAALIMDGYVRDDRTVYAGVEILESAATLTIRDDTMQTALSDPADLRCGTLTPTEPDFEALMGEIRHSVSTSAHGDVICTLTGGHDSRLVAAALHASGIPFRARTRGAADHPDVVVAAQVAAALGVPHERVPIPTIGRPGSSSDDELIEMDIAARARAVLFRSDGMLYAWENVATTIEASGVDGTVFGGGGGESLRGGLAKRLSADLEPSWEDAATYLGSRLDGIGRLFRPGVTDAYAQTLRTWVDRDRAAGIAAGISLDRYKVWYQTGRWRSAFLAVGDPRAVRHPLMDDRITRFGLRLTLAAKAFEQVNEGLTVRFVPALRDVAYYQKAPIHTRKDATTSAPRMRPFEWRRTTTDQMFPAFRQQLLDGRGSGPLATIVDRGRLEKWLTNRQGQPEGRSVRPAMFMWGMYTASVLLSNDWLEPDQGEPQVVRVRIPPGMALDAAD